MEELTRRTILTLPVLLLGSGEGVKKKPYTAPTVSDGHELEHLPFIKSMSSKELLEELVRLHDSAQLGCTVDAPCVKSLHDFLTKKSFRWVEQIHDTLTARGVELPPLHRAMMDRLKVVERTGQPVVFTHTTQWRSAKTGEPHWVPDTWIEMIEPVARRLPIRKGLVGWEADLPQGVEVVIKVMTPYKLSRTGLYGFHAYQYDREGKEHFLQITSTDPSDETNLVTRDWRDNFNSAHPITEPFTKRV